MMILKRFFAVGKWPVIDSDGYRANVGIILTNEEGRLFWARRIGQHAWQFPQGGLLDEESPEEALYRELNEEIGLQPDDVRVITCSRAWLRYRLPKNMRRHDSDPDFIGQKQKWFLLELKAPEDHICLDRDDSPEFDHWRWVSYWYPLKNVIAFKRNVYRRVLKEFLQQDYFKQVQESL